MKLSEELAWRGLIKDKTFADITWLDTPRKFYLGLDASMDSFTIGNLAVLILARRLISAGWQGVLLAGGATSLIGDPGGKEEERVLKSYEEISKNVNAIKTQIEKVLDGQAHELVNNLDWIGNYRYLDFLRDVGKHYSMTELMRRDFVVARMNEGGSGISYAEFSYSLLQGYDFWWLFKNKGVELQIGASDQWGNMLSGVPLIRKKEGKEAHAFSMPLIIDKNTGKKFGKSEAGAVWLDPEKTSPTQFYQFWINVDDSEVEDYLKIYTELPKEQVNEIMTRQKSNPSERHAQIRLAQEITKLVHSENNMMFAEAVTEYLTGETPISELDGSALVEVKKGLPTAQSSSNGSIVEMLVKTDLASSNGEARRLLESGAVYVNGQQTKRENFEPGDFQNGRLLLRRGKAFKDSALIELVQ